MGRPEKLNCGRNPLCYSTHKFCIKYGKQTLHAFGNSKLKPIDYVAFFELQEHSDSLTSSIYSITIVKRNKITSNKSSTIVKITSHEASDQIASLNEPKEN